MAEVAGESSLDGRLQEMEIASIHDALVRSEGKPTKAAAILGIPYRAIRYKMGKYGIEKSGNYPRKQFFDDNREIITDYLVRNRKRYTKEEMLGYMRDYGFDVDLDGLPEKREEKTSLRELKKLGNVEKISGLVECFPEYGEIIKSHMGDCDLDHSDECEFLFDLRDGKPLEFMERYYMDTYKIRFGPIKIVQPLYHPIGERRRRDNDYNE